MVFFVEAAPCLLSRRVLTHQIKSDRYDGSINQNLSPPHVFYLSLLSSLSSPILTDDSTVIGRVFGSFPPPPSVPFPHRLSPAVSSFFFFPPPSPPVFFMLRRPRFENKTGLPRQVSAALRVVLLLASHTREDIRLRKRGASVKM